MRKVCTICEPASHASHARQTCEALKKAKLYNTGPLQKRKIRGNTVRGPAVGQNIKSSATAVRGPAVTNSSIKQVTPWSAVFQCTRVRKHVPPRSAVCGHSYKSRGCRRIFR